MAPPTRRAAFLALLAVVSARPAQLAAPHFAQRDGHDVAVAAKVSTKCAFRNADGSISRVASAEDVCACGSNLPNKLYQLASRAYDEYSGNVGGHFDYAATGSNVGKESIVGALVDLAGTDSLLKDADYAAAPDLQMYPASASAVAPVFNLPSLVSAEATLLLDRATLPLIFLGDIFEWTDPRILALQVEETRTLLLQLPDPTIHVVVRDEQSGTTEIYTKALSKFSAAFAQRVGGADKVDWCEDGMEALPCPGETYTGGVCDSNPAKFNCFGANGECEGTTWVFDTGLSTSGTVTCNKPSHNGRAWGFTRGGGVAGVVAAVESLVGSIGYVALVDVIEYQLVQITMLNQQNFALRADLQTISFALLELGGFLDARGTADLFDAVSTYSYPIVGFTYYVLRKGVFQGVSYMDEAPEMFDCATRLKTLTYLEWFYTSPSVQAMAVTLGFTNLPSFISATLVDTILAQAYCIDADTGEARLVKEREAIERESVYTMDFAVQPLEVITTVYEESASAVRWDVALSAPSAALMRGDAGLGVTAISATESPKAAATFAAPFATLGFGLVYHLDGFDLSLSHDQVAAIYTCAVTSWKDVRNDLPDETIVLALRTDACDVNDAFTAALSFNVPTFASTIGRIRAFDADTMRGMGCTVGAEDSSDAQVEASVIFRHSSIGMWTKARAPSAQVASFKPVGGAAVVLDADALRQCQGATVSFFSSAFAFPSAVYDLSAAPTTEGCWPYAKSYSMVINEQLLGPNQCEPTSSVGGPGASAALRLMRYFYAGNAFDSLEVTHFVSPSIEDRGRVLAVLNDFRDGYCNPSSRVKTASQTLIVAIAVSLAGVLVILAGVMVLLHRRRMARLLKAQGVLPENVQELIDLVWASVRDQDGGAVADYIPELAKADATPFAIVLCDLKSGALYEAGDVSRRFSLQSACKPLLYCLALEDKGQECVDAKIGTEPTGGPFNVVSFDSQGRPFNPYVNAGAICTAGLVSGETAVDRFRRTSKLFENMSLGDACATGLDAAVFKSEMATNGNNQFIVSEALKRGLIPAGDGDLALEAYTMACSLSVDCREVAVVAATLANGGVNPRGGVRALPEWIVKRATATMMTCGMYNGAGAWMVDVGIPAKSGVGGVIMCVVPGVCGFAAFSPKLDQNGNSTRGVAVAREMSEKLGLHVLHQKAPVVPKFVDNGSKVDFSLDRITGRKRTPDNSRERVVARKHGSTPDNSQERVVARRDVPGASPMHALQRGRSARIEPSANYAGNAPADECRLAERIAEEP